ncbi:unnamed protein product, partial [Didymodactylos carnosus]
KALRPITGIASDEDTSLDLTDVSIISVGVSRFHDNMLTDDDEDIEVNTDNSDNEDEDEDNENVHFTTLQQRRLNDDIDIGHIDPDTQAKLAAILEATG